MSTGMIFSLPALVIIGYWDKIDWLQSSIVLLFGGILGVLFSIPIRRALIIENPLRFPEGVATAEVLFTTFPKESEIDSKEYKFRKHNTKKGLILLLIGAIVGALLKVAGSSFFLWSGIAYFSFWIQSAIFYTSITLSPAIIAIGYIIGFHACFMMLIGSIFCWWIATPLTMAYQDISYDPSEDPIDIVTEVWADNTRYIGIGAMLIGGLGTIFLLAKPIYNGIKSGILSFMKIRSQGFGFKNLPREDRDIPVPIIMILIGVFIIPLFLLCWYFTDIWYIGAFSSCLMLIFGFLFACVGAYLAGLVGSSQSPISGVTLATVITSALLLLIFLGFENPIGPPSAILIGAVICCATRFVFYM